MWSDRALSHKLVERARGVGFEALIVTVDGAVPSNREYNHHNGFEVPIRFNSRNVIDVMKKPGWLASVFLRQLLTKGMPRFENYPPEIADKITSKTFKKSKILKNDSLNWEDIKALRKIWPGPLLIKGILHPADAALAAEHGADGVIISNHGGRNLDSSMAPIDVLPEVVDRIGGRKTVIVDSGFRRGSDIVKALALGANAVGIGRATLFGTAAAGEAGAARAIAILREEIDRMLGLTGTTSIDQLNRDLLHIEGAENAPRRTAGVEDLRLAQSA
jgi:isopentenyl diphosphate isomerase/L-lactate dehydrogenase-like FMN-dependent dehydrogenase